jgi:tetrahydromethanopterin S-methyltransferase subunit B
MEVIKRRDIESNVVAKNSEQGLAFRQITSIYRQLAETESVLNSIESALCTETRVRDDSNELAPQPEPPVTLRGHLDLVLLHVMDIKERLQSLVDLINGQLGMPIA